MTTISSYDGHPLSRFLSARRAEDSKTASMTSLGTIKGKWFIADADYPEFLKLLNDYLFVKKFSPRGFVEQPRKGEPKPLLIDLDFQYSAEKSLVRTFTLEQVRSFCQLLVTGLQTFFGVAEFEEMRFFVTLRPAPYAAGQVRKDGIHILCPDVTLVDEKQKVIRNWMLAQDAIRTCFSGTEFVNEPEDIYDESMVRKQGWIFYGESKPNIQPYALQAVFRYTPEGDVWDEDATPYTPRQLLGLLSVRYEIQPDAAVVKEEAAELYVAMRDWGEKGSAQQQQPQQQAQEESAEVIADRNETLEALRMLYPTSMADEERTIIRRLVMECLDPGRANKYDTWIRVGWCLHNMEPSETNFALWMDFSAQSPKSSGNNIAQLKRDWFNGWRKDSDGPRLTERSLRHWARTDNPEQYKQIQSEYLGAYIKEQVEPSHHHIAKLLKKMHGSNYIASVNPRATDWYKYDDSLNMWKRLNQGMELRMKISDDVANEIGKARASVHLAPNAKDTDPGVLKKKELLKIEMHLYNSGFCDSVMKMAVHQFYEEEFEKKLNINPYLVGCRNGILDLRVAGTDGRDHVVFRDGRPEDYVSFLAGQNLPEMDAIEYKPYDPADPAQAEIADFFSKLFPDPDVRAYTLRLLSSCLEGTNREQCFYVATGVGGNGKSKLVELMRMTLGDYQTSMQSTVLTRKRPESGAANPDIMAAKCRRFIYLQEPDDREPMNTSRMKQFSGEDMVEARGLFQDQEKFVIMGKLFMMCNRLPPVNSMDRGTWRRIRVIEFVSKFVLPDHHEYISKRPNVFLIDPQLDKKLRAWREPFLALLVHIYEKEYLANGLNPVPAAVMRAVDKYKESFDVYARFRGERVREPVTTEEKLKARMEPLLTARVKSIISHWKKETRTELDFKDAINRLTEEFGEPVNGKEWPGILMFGSEEEVAEWDKNHATTE